MVFYQIEWARLLPIFIAQPLSAILFIGLAIKILVRKRDNVSISLAIFYVISSLSIIFNAVFVLLTTIEAELLLLYLFYFLTAYLLVFSPFFILLFLDLLLNIESKFTSRKNLVYLILYGIGCILVLLFPGGIKLDPLNNWRPVFSLGFFYLMYAFFTSVMFVPTIIYSIKLYRRFEAKNLKKKFRMLIIGIIEMLSLFYGTVLFNTTNDPLIRSIWGILSTLILISSALLIYFGIGQNL